MVLELAATAVDTSPWLDQTFGTYGPLIAQILQIIAIDILLCGDNAIVIAMACRSLPPEKRLLGIMLGSGAAIVLRIAFTLGLSAVLSFPYLMLVGGVLLLYIAVKLLTDSAHADPDIEAHTSVWGAVRTIALADAVMSLDNVIAIAGAAHGKPELIIFGLLVSIPLIVGGATLFTTLLTRFPILVWAGAALLGWIAGELIAREAALAPYLTPLHATLGVDAHRFEQICAIAGAVLVLLIGFLVRRWSAKTSEGVEARVR